MPVSCTEEMFHASDAEGGLENSQAGLGSWYQRLREHLHHAVDLEKVQEPALAPSVCAVFWQ